MAYDTTVPPFYFRCHGDILGFAGPAQCPNDATHYDAAADVPFCDDHRRTKQ